MLPGFKEFMFKDIPVLPVNMLEEISNFKRLNGKSPVIIINLTCLPLYAAHCEETLFGGRHDIYRKTVDDFFYKLKEAGAILEFCIAVIPVYVRRYISRLSNFDQMAIILDEIYKGMSVKETLNKNDKYLPLKTLKNNLLKIAQKNGSISKVLNYENLNNKMVEQAKKLNAFAIITDATAICFYDLPFKFWYGRDIHFEDCTTTEFNRERLFKEIGLKACHLPILGAFFGSEMRNNYFQIDFNLDFETKLKKIVDLIKNYEGQLNRKEIQEISNSQVRPFYRNLFAASYDNFTLNKKSKEPQEKIERFLFFENTVNNYLIVAGYETVYDVEFFDHRKQDFVRFNELRMSLVQRKAGILLQHKNNPELRHFYFSRKIHLVDLERNSFVPVYPEITVPPLDELLSPSVYPELNDVRYDLLCWTIDEKIKKSEILKFNSNYIVDVLVLYCGLKYKFIKPFEAMVILMTINTVITGKIPDNLIYPTHLDERAMRLSFVYLCIHGTIADIFHAVGLVNVPTATRFDGVFYHKLYDEWMNKSEEELNIVFEGYPDLQKILRFFK